MFKIFLSVVILFGSFVLTGCATPPDSKPLVPDQLNADDGVVMLKVVVVEPVSMTNGRWRSMTVVNEATQQKFEFSDSAPLNVGHSIFVGTLPQGKYKISGFSSTGPMAESLGLVPALVLSALTSDSASLGSQQGSFSVRSGGLANLGVLVSALPKTKTDQIQVAVLGDSVALASTLSDVDAETRNRVKSMVVSGWDVSPNPAASSKALDMVRTRARNVSAMAFTDDGELLIGSALGVVHLRDASGKWSMKSTGSLDNISYLRPLQGGRIFAAADAGRYYLWIPEAKTWRAYRLATGGRIIHLEPMGVHGFALAIQEQEAIPVNQSAARLKNRLLFKVRLDEGDEVKELVELPGFSATGGVPIFFDGEELLVCHNTVEFTRTATLYRVNPKTFATRAEKIDFWISDFYTPSKDVLVRDRLSGMSAYADLSLDRGRTWTNHDSGGVNFKRFADKDLGYGISTVSIGWSSATVALSRTTDGGKSWQRIGAPVESFGANQIRLAGNRIYRSDGRQIWSTTNEGRNWTVEWPQSAEGLTTER